MDTHRVFGYVLETLGQYNSAIQQYQMAAEITPNLTFLYVRIGQNFREGIRDPARALEYFEKAANIDKQLGVENPVPYLEIARTYSQEGQFFAASLNAEEALALDPTRAHTYGQFGLIYRRARNYEGALPLLKCAVKGCTAEENEMGEVDVEGLPLTNLRVAYYYLEYGTNLAFLNEMGAVDVEGLPLTNLRVAYYYLEYGTNLAFLSRPHDNYCQEAFSVLQEVRAAYPDDPILMDIVEDSEGICRRLESGFIPEATTTEGGFSPEATTTPEVTLTPEPEQMTTEQSP
jgi:tetratricopeptide (TPR) repeat protein